MFMSSSKTVAQDISKIIRPKTNQEKMKAGALEKKTLATDEQMG